jgi:hypothetical protein
MHKVLKWLSIIMGVVTVLLLIAAAAVYGISTNRFNRTYDVQSNQLKSPQIKPQSIMANMSLPFAVAWQAYCSSAYPFCKPAYQPGSVT